MPASGRKLFGKHKKPLNTQRVVISDTQKSGIRDKAGSIQNTSSPVDYTDIYEEPFLEDTPVEGVIFDKNLPGKHRSGTSIEAEKPAFEKINTGTPITGGYRGNNMGSQKTEGFSGNNVSKSREAFRGGNTERRYNANKKSGFNIFSAILLIFKKKSKTSNSSALDFASSRKRLGKKGRRNRRIFIYAGTGLAVTMLTLIIVFVPGKATPVDTQSPGVSQQPTTASYAAVNSADVSGGSTVSGSPTVLPSVSPTPSPTPIPTTSVDPTPARIDLEDEVQKFRVEADKYYNQMGYSNNHYKYTPEEVTILAKVIYGEARSETEEGKIAVANVVMNRVLNRSKFGNTITAVVTKSQFSGYNPDCTTTGLVYRKCLSAAKWVLDWEVWVIPQDIYYYERAKEEYFYGAFYTKIGDHCFYRTAYSGRSKNRGIPPRLFERTFEWPTIGCKKEDRVIRLQYMLNKLGYSKVKADGYFGQDTKDAVIDFQKKHGLRDDGIAGQKTLERLIKEFGFENYYDTFLKDKN